MNKIELDQNSLMSDLSTFVKKNQARYMNKEKYSDEIIKYMLYIEPDFKNKIIEKAKELIETDKNSPEDCFSLVNKMFKENYMNKNKTDIISCILDYIKENIFSKYLKLILNLEKTDSISLKDNSNSSDKPLNNSIKSLFSKSPINESVLLKPSNSLFA